MRKEQLYRLSKGIKKKSKKEIYTDIINSAVIIENDSSLQNLFVDLFNFFQPTISKKDKFIVNAIDKNHYKPSLLYARVENGYISSTDGKRLHQETTTLKNGYYDRNMNKVYELDTNEVCFPECNEITESAVKKNKSHLNITVKDFIVMLEMHNPAQNQIKIKFGDENYYFNQKCIYDALSGLKDDDIIDIYYNENNTLAPLLIKVEIKNKRLALIMPMRKQ